MYRQPQSGFHRVPFVQICDFDDAGTRRRALICNLSTLGVYIHTESPPEIGREVMITFRLPDDGSLVLAEAAVTWVNDDPAATVTALPHGFGARFTSVAPDDVRRIAELVAAFVASPREQAQAGVGVPRSGKVRIPYIADCAFDGSEGPASGSVCNLSTLGIYAALDRIPEVGERGRVRFPVPGRAQPFSARVTVAWSNPEFGSRMLALPPGCGLRFEGLTVFDEAVLANLVDEYLASPGNAKADGG